MQDHTTPQSPQEIPYGHCHCGCGKKTTVYKGKARRYCFGHGRRAQGGGPNPSGFCQCGCGKLAPIARRSNAEKGHILGKPVRYIMGHNGRHKTYPSVNKVFWSKFEKGSQSQCWEWPTKHHGQYGHLYFENKHYLAHRFSYELHFGSIPDEMCVCHSCDNPSCVNPHHLWLGTQAENISDKVRKNRQARPKGKQVGTAKLTAKIVLEVRERVAKGEAQTSMARHFGVSVSAISSIVRRKTWKHV